jgi:hypothetical protein
MPGTLPVWRRRRLAPVPCPLRVFAVTFICFSSIGSGPRPVTTAVSSTQPICVERQRDFVAFAFKKFDWLCQRTFSNQIGQEVGFYFCPHVTR